MSAEKLGNELIEIKAQNYSIQEEIDHLSYQQRAIKDWISKLEDELAELACLHKYS